MNSNSVILCFRKEVCLETNPCCYTAVSLLLGDAFRELHESSLSSRLRQTFMWYCMIVSDSGAGEVLLVSQLLTAAASWQDRERQQRWQQQMILHTEGQQSRGETVIYLLLFRSLLFLPFSSPHSLFWQSRSACQCGCLPSIHPSIRPCIHPSKL